MKERNGRDRSRFHARAASLAALAAVAVGLGVWLWFGERAAPATEVQEAALVPGPAAAPASLPAAAARTAVPASATALPPTAEAPPAAAFTPYVARVRVLDLGGAPVPGAEVASGAAPGPDAREPRPSHVLTTDATGCVALPIDQERFWLEAHKAGVGWSGRIPANAWLALRLKDNWVLTLKPRNLVRGVVLRAHGAPAAGVTVTTLSTVGSLLELGRVVPAPVTTDAEGRFQLEVGWDDAYELSAQDGAARTPSVRVDTQRSAGGESRDAVLRFPGAFGVRGELRDPQGRALAGEVRAFAARDALASGERWRLHPPAAVASDGQLALVLPAPGGYRLVGSAPGHPDTGPIEVAVTEAQPQVQVELRLPAPGQILGRVVWDDGLPAVEVQLTLAADDPGADAAGEPPLRDLYGVVPAVATDAEGRFRFACVHPALAYVLTCHVGRCGRVTLDGVRASSEELQLVVSRREAAGFALELHVRDTEGKAVPRYSVQLLTLPGRSHGSVGQATKVQDPQGRATIPGLSFRERYALNVQVPGRGMPATFPVRAPDGPLLVLSVVLQELAGLVVTVVDHDGRPLPQATVHPVYPIAMGWGLVPLPTDAEGRVTFSHLEAGPLQVHARLPDGRSTRQEVTLAAGGVNRVELRIPRRE